MFLPSVSQWDVGVCPEMEYTRRIPVYCHGFYGVLWCKSWSNGNPQIIFPKKLLHAITCCKILSITSWYKLISISLTTIAPVLLVDE